MVDLRRVGCDRLAGDDSRARQYRDGVARGRSARQRHRGFSRALYQARLRDAGYRLIDEVVERRTIAITWYHDVFEVIGNCGFNAALVIRVIAQTTRRI